MSDRKSPPRKLIPVGDVSALDREQLAYVQAYMFAWRWCPSGNRTAHNVQVLADRIHELKRRR